MELGATDNIGMSETLGDEHQYLTFIMSDEEYGVDILAVQEIRGWEEPTFIPNAPNYIRGVINLRGTVVPIMDLRLRFGLDEVDYGPDENKTEEEVIARIGEQAIKDWDDHAIVPDGWRVHPEDIRNDWLQFGLDIANQLENKTTLVVTSNGIARFAPHLTRDFDNFKKNNNIKLSTGALAYLEHDGENWHIKEWNVRP